MNKKIHMEEVRLQPKPGVPLLILNIVGILAGITGLVFGIIFLEDARYFPGALLLTAGILAGFVICPILFVGFKSVRPNEAIVFTKFGEYLGTLRDPGFYYVSAFARAVTPPAAGSISGGIYSGIEVSSDGNMSKLSTGVIGSGKKRPSNKMSLKTMTLNNDRQKINDVLGNPIEIGIVVIWRVENTVKAMFDVDDYVEYLSIQCDSALRSIVRMYPYDANDDVSDDATERSLRGSSQEIALKLQDEIQNKVAVAGLEIIEARITHLAYAPEIAAAMLQRQQASAIVDARQLIVDGAVGMVEMALDKLSENNVVHLDEERKAAMVSNLLVVLCGNRDAQPIVNSGTLY
jgi:Membrane protease subunits, stomatin/prohibitin homologs